MTADPYDEIARLRAHIRTTHQLNGYSKQRGWWCSCGTSITLPDEHPPRDERPTGWQFPFDRRDEAIALHRDHVDCVLFGVDAP